MAVAGEAVRVSAPPTVGLIRWLRKHRVEFALALPLIVYILALTLAPIIDTLRLSLTTQFESVFPSIDNYRAIARSEVFRTAAINTVMVALISLALELGVGLTVALALHVRFPLRAFVRTVVLVPLGVPTIVSGAVMLLVFSRSGYLNSLVAAVYGLLDNLPGIDLEFQALNWAVAGGFRTLLTVAIADMWKVLPVVVLIFLAGLQSIPEDVYEAADVDGASKWQRFARITFPLLVPYITMAIILRAIDAFRIFELALVIAGRIEPVLGTFIWNRYAPPTSDPFTAAAGSIALFGIIMVFIILYLRFVARRAELRA